MTRDLSRLFQPKSIAVIGGGAWCRSVTEQLVKVDFDGDIWPVHPRADDICGLKAYPTAIDLPGVPDATFVGINRDASIGAVERLARMGAGGAVCFASGFGEADDGAEAHARLLHAAKDMPILGPNCYGMINAFDGAMLWPDQHGLVPVERGVAILTQSSNIAINLTMQMRGLPIGYMITCGNQAQLSMADIAYGLLDDPRVTAIGLHIEGFGDLPSWQALARKAHDQGIPLVALKVGRSHQARAATISHTASLAGDDAGAQALLEHLGIARVDDLPTLLETLKLLHVTGPLPSGRLASISCSGGEASLIADMAYGSSLHFPDLTDRQKDRLAKALGPKVQLANPLDYHTYIWRDIAAMSATFTAMIEPDLALTMVIVDFPREDRCDPSDWDHVIEALIETKRSTGGRIALVSTLPELLPEPVAAQLMQAGITPLHGLSEALAAAEAARQSVGQAADLIVPTQTGPGEIMTEHAAKSVLKAHGLTVPAGQIGDLDEVLGSLGPDSIGPYVLKAIGSAHKSDEGGVVLGLTNAAGIVQAASDISAETFLLEEMVTDGCAELLIGVVKDPAHGFILTLGAGGVLTEILDDSTSVLVPATRDQIKSCLTRLKMAPILSGYRGRPAPDIDQILNAVEAIQSFVLAHLDEAQEVEVNPLICTPTRAVAADALIRKTQ